MKEITLDFYECDSIAALCADHRDLLVETISSLGNTDEDAEAMASEIIEKFNYLLVQGETFKVTKI
jgi:hypothetical protein